MNRDESNAGPPPTQTGSSTKPPIDGNILNAGLDATPEPDSAASDDSPQLSSSDARSIANATDEDEECCIVCDMRLEDGDLVYWEANDIGYMHAECCGPERESYVNSDGSPLAERDPIPKPFVWKAEGRNNG